MKFGHLIEYNMRHIFLKNHTQNAVYKLFSDPYTVYFIVSPRRGLSKDIETMLVIT